MPHVELPQAEFKVVILGDTNTGKTSLVLRFAEGYYRNEARSATMGAFFITKRIQTSNGITCKVQIWDTAGQSQFRKMAPMYYNTAAAAIICYDVTNPQSYHSMCGWLEELHQSADEKIVIAIVATKNDLMDGAVLSTLVSTSEVERMAEEIGALFLNTSAKTNTNINLLFQRVSERVLQADQVNSNYPQTDNPILTPGRRNVYENEPMINIGAGSPRTTNIDGQIISNSDNEKGNKNENIDESEGTTPIGTVTEDSLAENSLILCGSQFIECGDKSERPASASCIIS